MFQAIVVRSVFFTPLSAKLHLSHEGVYSLLCAAWFRNIFWVLLCIVCPLLPDPFFTLLLSWFVFFLSGLRKSCHGSCRFSYTICAVSSIFSVFIKLFLCSAVFIFFFCNRFTIIYWLSVCAVQSWVGVPTSISNCRNYIYEANGRTVAPLIHI